MPDAVPRSTEDVVPERRPRVSQKVWWLGFAVTVFVGAVLSYIAYSEGLAFDALPQLDKAVHFAMGGALAFFLDGVLRRRIIAVGRVAIPLAAVLVLVPAGIEELLQRFSINRTSSFADYAADVLGVTVFLWLSRKTER